VYLQLVPKTIFVIMAGEGVPRASRRVEEKSWRFLSAKEQFYSFTV
jgi:hypothetical protein